MIIAQISDTHIVPKGQEWKSLPETKVASRLKLIVDHLNGFNFENANAEEVKVMELVRPSFTLHKWMGDFKLISEVVQTIESENRLSLPEKRNNEMD